MVEAQDRSKDATKKHSAQVQNMRRVTDDIENEVGAGTSSPLEYDGSSCWRMA
jgi:hypothetical protein